MKKEKLKKSRGYISGEEKFNIVQHTFDEILVDPNDLSTFSSQVESDDSQIEDAAFINNLLFIQSKSENNLSKGVVKRIQQEKNIQKFLRIASKLLTDKQLNVIILIDFLGLTEPSAALVCGVSQPLISQTRKIALQKIATAWKINLPKRLWLHVNCSQQKISKK